MEIAPLVQEHPKQSRLCEGGGEAGKMAKALGIMSRLEIRLGRLLFDNFKILRRAGMAKDFNIERFSALPPNRKEKLEDLMMDVFWHRTLYENRCNVLRALKRRGKR